MKAWRKRLLVGALAAGLQGLILGLAVLIGVMDPVAPREARIRAKPDPERQQRQQRERIDKQLAQLDRTRTGTTEALMEPLMEAMRPELAVSAPDPGEAIQAMGSLLQQAALFGGDGGAFTEGLESDSLPEPEPVAFLGENLKARRIVLLLDVSGSVKTKMERAGLPLQQLKREVHRFVDQLGPNHLFGIIQFTRKWQPFRDELVPATEVVRGQARQWIDSSFRTTGTSGRNWNGGHPNGIEAVLSAAFAMDPQLDEVFLVSDGDFQRTPPGGGGQDVPWSDLRSFTRTLQETAVGKARLRLLCFHPPKDALPDLRAWVRENGPGSLRVLDESKPGVP